MKRILIFLGLMVVFAAPSLAQNQTVLRSPYESPVVEFDTNETGPCWGPMPAGTSYFSLRINVIGTVSAGTVKLVGSDTRVDADTCGTDADIIAAQDVTMVTAVNGTEGAARFIQLEVESFMGTGTIQVMAFGDKLSTALGSAVTVTSGTITANLGATDNAVLDAIAADIAAIEAGNAASSVTDPCDGQAKTYVPIDITTATVVELGAAVASQHFYICGVNLVTAAANNVVIASDDTDNCVSITAGLFGGTTAAEGWNFAANGGIALGNGGSTVLKTATANHYLCILTSAATQLSGGILYVQAP